MFFSALFPGTYTCVATTSQGSSTDSGTLTVTGIPPRVIAAPSAHVVTEGSKVTVLCTVEGFPKPKHRWFNVSLELMFFFFIKALLTTSSVLERMAIFDFGLLASVERIIFNLLRRGREDL